MVPALRAGISSSEGISSPPAYQSKVTRPPLASVIISQHCAIESLSTMERPCGDIPLRCHVCTSSGGATAGGAAALGKQPVPRGTTIAITATKVAITISFGVIFLFT